MNIIYEKDGHLIVTSVSDELMDTYSTIQELIDDRIAGIANYNYVVFQDNSILPTEPIDTWYLKDGQIQVDQQKLIQYNRSLLPKLSKRQFALYLYDTQQYDIVMNMININPRFKIEYDLVFDIERLSPTVEAMIALLGWTDEQVDQMWQQALSL